MSMQTSLIIGFVALSTLPLALAVGIAIQSSSAQARQQVLNQLDSVADIKAASLSHAIKDSQAALRSVLASDDEMGGVHLLLAGRADELVLEDITDEMAANLEAQHGQFAEYFIYDLEGNIVASTSPEQIGKIIRRQAYFEHSLDEEHVQPPFYELGKANLDLVLSRPLVGTNGRIAGVLAGRLDLTHLAEVMEQRTGLGNTGETYLVSLENNYLITPSRFEGYPLNRSYHSTGIDDALSQKDGRGEYTSYRDTAVFGAYRWLPDLELGLVAEMEQSEALAASNATLLTTTAITGMALVVSALVGTLLAVTLTGPVMSLTTTTRQLAAGNLDVRATPEGPKETQELGVSFNTMADRVSTTLKDLEASVKEAQIATAMAREANRLKSEFLSTMSHELRTPLNAIIGFTELLIAGLSGPLNEKQTHKIERIHLNSKRLLELINNLLDLAKIEAGRIEVLHDPFEPARLVASVQGQMESLAEKKGLRFASWVDPDLPPMLMGDEARIAQVVNNLLSNAFKFTSHGEVELRVKTASETSWTISVRDTGIGIPPHALDFIFEEFRQVDGTSQRAYGGSGLGLAITRNLTRIMGGEVHVSSKLGEGSTFTVILPMVVPERVGEMVA
jgi:signal transduction histidine kinase